jgi:hypothetical protein
VHHNLTSKCARVPDWARRWVSEPDISWYQFYQSLKAADSLSWGILSRGRQSNMIWRLVWSLAHPNDIFLAHLTLTFGKLITIGALGWVSSPGDEFWDDFLTDFNSVSLGGCQTHKDRGRSNFPIKITKFDTPYLFYLSSKDEFQFKTALIFEKIKFLGIFSWKFKLLYFRNDFWVLLISLIRN